VTTLLIATRNAHKTEEIKAALSPKFRYLTLSDFPTANKVTEDGATFVDNACKKALEIARWLLADPRQIDGKVSAGERFFVLADDSGLEVDALNGAPGVHSARFAALDVGGAANSPDNANNAKLLRLLAPVSSEKRTARFRCVLALAPVGTDRTSRMALSVGKALEDRTLIFEGFCEGQIDSFPRGTQGFGYDPLFVPVGYSQSFAELGIDVKNQISHRALALAQLRQWMKSHGYLMD
jgi:XTP/dITP diphosphohydrolase